MPSRSFHMEVVDPDMARALASKTEAERLQIAWGMWRSAREMITRIVTAENPEMNEKQVQLEVARRLASE